MPRSLLFVVPAVAAVLMTPTARDACAQGGAKPEAQTLAAERAGVERAVIDGALSAAYPSLVRILVVTTEAWDGRLQKFQSAGSGTIVTPQGHVVTNHHVAGRALRIMCDMPDGERIDADLVGADALTDIAVIRLRLDSRKDPKKPLPVASWGDSDALRVGDPVLALGSPGAMSQSVTLGIISNTRMVMPPLGPPRAAFRLEGEDVGSIVRWITHDAQIFGGNSGGPLVDLRGRIVGVNEIGIAGLGGAIPANLARSVAEQIIASGEVTRSWIGADLQPRLRSSGETRGVLVSGVLSDSPAAKAGVRPGDLLLTLDGTPTDAAIAEDVPAVNRVVLGIPVGKAAAARVLREGKEVTLSITTEAREHARGKDEELRNWGFTARDFTRVSAIEAQRPDGSGVRIDTMRQGGPASEAKPALEPGDIVTQVAGKPVVDIAALRSVTAEATKDKPDRVPLLVGFDRGNRKMMTVVRVGPDPDENRPASARRAWLGVATQPLTRELAEALRIPDKTGVRVTQVYPGTEADKAGFKVGDILLTLEGDAIQASKAEDNEVFANMIRRRKIGDAATLGVLRGEETLQIKATLETPPMPASEAKRHKDEDFEMTLREMTVDDRLSRRLDDADRGVLIEKIEPASWPALARVGVGDILLAVNGEPTHDIAAAEKALAAARASKARFVTFFVRRGVRTMYFELEPTWDIIRP